MTTITAAGSGSGLDIEGIVTSLVEAERAPVENRLNLQEAKAQATITAFGSLKGALADFQKTAQGLQDLADFQTRTVISSNTDTFIATGTNEAATINTSIEVSQLAKAHKLASDDFATSSTIVGTGSLVITSNNESFQINVSSSNQTLEGIRDSINDATNNVGVSASILTVDDGSGGTVSKLILTADTTGTDNEISIVVDDDDGSDTNNSGLSRLFFVAGDINNQMTEVDPAQDAQILVDGFQVSSNTNVFENAIQGVTITAVEADPGVEETLQVSLDKLGTQTKIENFVEKFNSLIDVLNELTDYDSATNTSGLLTGDATASAIENQIRRILGNSVTGINSQLTNLAELGVRTEKDGSLTIDNDVLSAAIDNNFDDVGKVFSGDDGIAQQLDDLLSQYLDNSGILSTRTDGLDRELDEIAIKRSDLELRLESVERRIRSQFIAMDLLVAQLNSTGTFLTQQLDITNNIVKDFGNN
ncbi:MAG: flagellar filament capping protein FliD [Gammaproteobacteria bacterium]|nr:flagellar filament capping protein FliD [Gammaproteobacteria bacterium]